MNVRTKEKNENEGRMEERKKKEFDKKKECKNERNNLRKRQFGGARSELIPVIVVDYLSEQTR